MLHTIHADCPTYMELGLKNGEVNTINGKELNKEGVTHVIDYLCQEVEVKTEDVLTKVKGLKKSEGSVVLKLYNGMVTAV